MGFDRQFSHAPTSDAASSGSRESQWWPRTAPTFPQGDGAVPPSIACDNESSMPPPPPLSRQAGQDSWSSYFSYPRRSQSQRSGTESASFYHANNGLTQDWPVSRQRGSQLPDGSVNGRTLTPTSFQSYGSASDHGLTHRAPMAEMTSDYRQNAQIPVDYPEAQVDTTLPAISAWHRSSSKRLRED